MSSKRYIKRMREFGKWVLVGFCGVFSYYRMASIQSEHLVEQLLIIGFLLLIAIGTTNDNHAFVEKTLMWFSAFAMVTEFVKFVQGNETPLVFACTMIDLLIISVACSWRLSNQTFDINIEHGPEAPTLQRAA